MEQPQPAGRTRRRTQPSKKQTRNNLERTGTLATNPRGFGFVEFTEGNSVFVPERMLEGFIDADIVTVTVREGQARQLTLNERVRQVVVGDITTNGMLTVDRGLGRLTLPVDNSIPAGTAVVANLPKTGNGQAHIIEILGDRSSDEAVARRILGRHQLPHDYPQEAISQQAHMGSSPTRRDLTGMTVITIDDDSSTDLDDALSAEPSTNGSIRVYVHIADVSEHVLPGSPVDRHASNFPTSVYLPQRVVHMLPSHLGADALSLLPGEDRDTVTVEMRISADGDVSSVDVYESRIRSTQRLSYDAVATAFMAPQTTLASPVAELLRLLQAASARLTLSRSARGGIDMIHADPDRAVSPGDDAAHMLIERLMVATNESVARWLEDRGMPVLYRAHPPLSDTGAGKLEQAAAGFGLYIDLPRPVTPKSFAAVSVQVARSPQEKAFWDATMRVLERALYTTGKQGHFGLGSDAYLHFTSPLRRYSDLLTHRIVKEYLAGARETRVAGMRDALESHVLTINLVTRKADKAERDARRAAALKPVKARQSLTGVVVSTGPRGSTVFVNTLGITVNTAEQAPIGARVTVRVRKVDAPAGLLEVTIPDAGSKPAGKTRIARKATVTGSDTTSTQVKQDNVVAGSAAVEKRARARRKLTPSRSA